MISFLLAQLSYSQEKEYFLENLGLLLSAGMNILPALDSIAAEVRSPRLQSTIAKMRQLIEDGSPIYRALEESRLVPAHIVSLVRVGEQAGRLTENLKLVTLQQAKDREFRSKLRSALMYPTLVLVLTVLVGLGVAWYILPRLSQVFAQLKVELPLITKVLIGIGSFLARYGVVAVPAVIFLIGGVVYFLFFRATSKFIGQELLLRFPLIKGLIQEVEISRFGFILGTLLQAGIPVTESLKSLAQSTSVRSYQRLYLGFAAAVEEGNSFEKCFKRFGPVNHLIPRSIQQLVAAGEQSGQLPEVLERIADNYDRKTEVTTKNLAVILEPALLVVVWLGVVTVALAVMLPIYGLLGGINR